MFMVTIQLQQMSNSQLRLLSLSTASQLDMELIDNSTELFYTECPRRRVQRLFWSFTSLNIQLFKNVL